jgi:hypothetical protein
MWDAEDPLLQFVGFSTLSNGAIATYSKVTNSRLLNTLTEVNVAQG